jgi:hypothetical protein
MLSFLAGLLGGVLAVALVVAGSFALLLLSLTRFEAPEYDTGYSCAAPERRRLFAFDRYRNDGQTRAAEREQNWYPTRFDQTRPRSIIVEMPRAKRPRSATSPLRAQRIFPKRGE